MKSLKLKTILFLIIFFIFSMHIVSANSLNKDILFTSEYCLECRNMDIDILEICKERNIEVILTDNDENRLVLKEFAEENNIAPSIPMLYLNGEIYTDSNEIEDLLANGEVSIKNPLIFGFLGFMDGFNPCAISILMLFISLLLSIGMNKKTLLVGFSFVIGETISNFLLGMGFIKITESLKTYNIIINSVYVVSLLICLYVFVINIIDIVNGFRKKKEIKNQLSDNVKFKISGILSRNIFSKYIVILSFFMGIVIAILEFGCTGQLYLPSVLNMEGSLFYLIVYNLFFSLPLLIVLIISYIINKPEKIKEFIMKNSYLLKIFLNIIILVLSINILNKLF